MIKFLSNIHKGQSGVIISALIAVVFTLLSAGWAWWWVRENVDWPSETATPVLPDRAVGWEWSMFGCGADSGTPGGELNAEKGTVICPSETIWIEEFDYRIGRQATGDKVVSIDIWTWDNTDGRDVYLGSSMNVPVNSLPAWNGANQVQPWATFTFADDVILYAGTWYTIHVNLVSGSTGAWYTTVPYGTTCIGAITKGYFYENPGPGWSNAADVDYYVKGYVSAEPEVKTIPYELNLDHSVMLYGSAQVIGDMECGFLASDDYDTVVAGTGTQYVADQTGWNAGVFPFNYRLTSYQPDTEYSYRAYAEAYGQRWYGDVYNFTITEVDWGLDLYCSVIDNSINNVRFESEVLGTTGNISYNVSIAYGTNQSQCMAVNGSISIVNNLTTDGVWFTDVPTGTQFDEATTYYYRLRVAGNDSSIAHSTMKSFTTWDPDIPDWLQSLIMWINRTFDTHLEVPDVQWWIVGLLLLAAWAIAGILKWKWVGVIGTGAIFIWLVVLELVPVWVVILAILIGAWIIFKLVFARAHEETITG